MPKTLAELLAKRALNFGILPGRVSVVKIADLDLAGIERGVILVYCGWSGPCASFFPGFMYALADAKELCPPVFIVDGDDPDILRLYEAFGETSHGYGESFWIKDGKLAMWHKGTGADLPIARFIEQFNDIQGEENR